MSSLVPVRLLIRIQHAPDVYENFGAVREDRPESWERSLENVTERASGGNIMVPQIKGVIQLNKLVGKIIEVGSLLRDVFWRMS